MGKLEITITDETKSSQVQGFVRALQAYSGVEPQTVKKPEPAKEEQPEKSEDAKEEKPTKAKRKTRKSKKTETPEAEESKKSDSTESKSDKDEPTKEESKSDKDDKPSVTIEQIRGLQKDVVVEHKSAIIDKLRGELGAKNLSTLEEKHYEDYYKFLKGLKDGE